MKYCLFICLLLVGCAPERFQGKVSLWPASVWGWENFTEQGDDSRAVQYALQDMNTTAKKLVINVAPIPKRSYPIYIKRVSFGSQSRILGKATRALERCTIELDDRLFSVLGKYLEAVIWHEVGHCAGLGHETEAGHIMSPYAAPLDSFEQDELDYFFEQIERSVTLL